MAPDIRQSGRCVVGNFLLGKDRTKDFILQILIGSKRLEKIIQDGLCIILRHIALDISCAAQDPRNAQELLWL